MKKLAISLLLCGLMFSFAACSESPSSSNSSSAGDSSLPIESSVSEPDESSDEASDETSGTEETSGDEDPSDTEESSVTGTIKEVSDESITLELEDGTQLSIPIADADTSEVTDGLNVDSAVTVYYIGTIEDTDTSQITVNRITPAE